VRTSAAAWRTVLLFLLQGSVGTAVDAWNIDRNRVEYFSGTAAPPLPVARAVRVAIALPKFYESFFDRRDWPRCMRQGQRAARAWLGACAEEASGHARVRVSGATRRIATRSREEQTPPCCASSR
jgi:hypothetical protein